MTLLHYVEETKPDAILDPPSLCKGQLLTLRGGRLDVDSCGFLIARVKVAFTIL